uniref:Uncharacterized protein n=1 Tax=Glossina pallidipes TaxID=7398 RepID=A0A1A9Z4H6_GLOPL
MLTCFFVTMARSCIAKLVQFLSVHLFYTKLLLGSSKYAAAISATLLIAAPVTISVVLDNLLNNCGPAAVVTDGLIGCAVATPQLDGFIGKTLGLGGKGGGLFELEVVGCASLLHLIDACSSDALRNRHLQALTIDLGDMLVLRFPLISSEVSFAMVTGSSAGLHSERLQFLGDILLFDVFMKEIPKS